MAFPNASKKNRPTLKVGDLCYARVSSAEKDLEAVLECMDSSTGRDAGFGQLDGGMVAEVSLGFARELLLNEAFPLLPEMARHAQFEVAIGVNGKIWVKAETVRTTLCCIRAIEACQERPQAEFKTTVKRVFKELREGTE
ncbi:ADL196Wp [Eremothecium gossypii ATCC 10895]|uniref:ADL196Wp n=1 Tax=Eremothecium gossypii (strain ATCC 10895 / CBS 109.51 / FGSC 9923 / NRRL Y-1056) TaxID=284811 RepID=Q75AW6_EREGS|nr:ADL196Wp [Eremothecium gossypii ATCC 10895]AAS51724.2 ADL196Wp [Eremothecium gossypii ATCC 10895]AEY96021.1 FADL196Wp [Eremothecium gossypii FDAG1]